MRRRRRVFLYVVFFFCGVFVVVRIPPRREPVTKILPRSSQDKKFWLVSDSKAKTDWLLPITEDKLHPVRLLKEKVRKSSRENGNQATRSTNKGQTDRRQEAMAVKRSNLLILSQGRSGSSLLGELFNANPNVFYVFEPLHTARKFLESSTYIDNKSANYSKFCQLVLDSFFRCSFTGIGNTLPEFSRSMFRLRSRALTGDLLCNGKKKPRHTADLKNPKICTTLTTAMLNKACSSHKHTTVKVLTSRIPNKTVESIRGLLEEQTSGYDLKIVHLIRDPRAVVYSWVASNWIPNYTDPNFPLRVHQICEPIEKILRLGFSSPSWLKNRLKVIRYEDLTTNTTLVARQLYRFLGFDWSVDVERLIPKLHRNPSKSQSKNPYSLYRNASVVQKMWKEGPETLIRVTEEICGDLMDIMGYQKLKTIPKYTAV